MSCKARVALVAVALGVGGAMTGCGGGPAGSTQPAPAQRFVAARFASRTGANRWLPLVPGTRWVRQGATDVGHRRVPHRVVSTVTDVYRVVDGVRAVAVLDQDIDASQVSQESLDYFAEGMDGTVWDLGSYTEALEGGRFVSVRDAWLAGVKGGRPGIQMPADPRARTPPYSRVPQFVGERMRGFVRRGLGFRRVRACVAVCPRASEARGALAAGVGPVRPG